MPAALAPSTPFNDLSSGMISMARSSEVLSAESAMRATIRSRATLQRVLPTLQPPPGDELSFSKLVLAELMKAKRPFSALAYRTFTPDVAEIQSPSDIVGELETTPASLPAPEAAAKLVTAYFNLTNLSMPLLHRPLFEEKMALIYGISRTIDLSKTHVAPETRIASFFVLEVFAVAILLLQKQEPAKCPTWMADRYHSMAVRALSEAGLPNNVEGVQALLLLAQFSYLHPALWGFWKTVGAALRLGVEIGLHEDPSCDGKNYLEVDISRRTFWVAYAMDRNVSMNLGIPSCLSDGAITAKVIHMISLCEAVMLTFISFPANWKTNRSRQAESRLNLPGLQLNVSLFTCFATAKSSQKYAPCFLKSFHRISRLPNWKTGNEICTCASKAGIRVVHPRETRLLGREVLSRPSRSRTTPQSLIYIARRLTSQHHRNHNLLS